MQGFEARAYKVLLDGEPVESLEQMITLTRGTKITFLRLIPLVGG